MKLNPLLFVLLLLPSCARVVNVQTNAFADHEMIPSGFPLGTSFAVVPMQHEQPLFSKEVARKIGVLLTARGYTVTDQNTADYLLFFNFGSLAETRTVQVPTYVPGPSESVIGTIFSGTQSIHYEEEKEQSGTLVYTPENITVFSQELFVWVFDGNLYRKTSQEEQIWHASSVSTRTESDLRDGIDYLLVSAFNFFGRNTKRNVEVSLTCKDPLVKWLKET